MIVNNIPSQNQSKPWLNNWKNWDDLVTTIATNSVQNQEPVDYWDVWGEPDNFWTGTYSQWIELYRRTDSVLTSIIPAAKIIGPEFGFGSCNFDAKAIIQFLDSLHQKSILLAGISWHEFCNPQQVENHVQQVRDSLQKRPWLSNIQILIPEYAGPSNHTIPGWNVGWLYYLEKSNIDWASHGCWNETDGLQSWSDCEFGLNGLFMRDNKTPQPNYWVHRAYAEMNADRITVASSNKNAVCLASKMDTTKEIKLLIGRFENPNLGMHNPATKISLLIKNYLYCSNCSVPLTILKIPSNNVKYSVPLLQPEFVMNGSANVIGDSTLIEINQFVDGDAYLVYLNPAPNSMLKHAVPTVNPLFSIYPNPATSHLTVKNISQMELNLSIMHSSGKIMLEQKITETTTIPIQNFAPGIYFIQCTNSTGQKDVIKFFK